MSRESFKTCRDCHTVLWPVRGLGRVCPICDALSMWPTIMASYRPGPWTDERSAHPAGSARTRVETPDSELQRDVDRIIRGTPYDWEQEGDAR